MKLQLTISYFCCLSIMASVPLFGREPIPGWACAPYWHSDWSPAQNCATACDDYSGGSFWDGHSYTCATPPSQTVQSACQGEYCLTAGNCCACYCVENSSSSAVSKKKR